jgi:hypothetical protein
MNIRFSLLLIAILFISNLLCYAGPPFLTDDPVPVDYKHWEFYLSTVNTFRSLDWTGTSPHFEVNYGLIPNVQLHLLLPVNYIFTRHEGSKFGYADTEFGVKFRFLQESRNSPQIGIFPIIEIPTIKNDEFSDGKIQVYLPVWIQKSWGKLTTYGGAGYWINPGTNNKNWLFSGWEIQYDFSSLLTFGGELYYQSADVKDGKSLTAFNLGGLINVTEKFHIIYSIGHSITNENFFNSYLGLLVTI